MCLILLTGAVVAVTPVRADPTAPIVIEGPVRLVPEGGEILRLEGAGRYRGVLEVGSDRRRTLGVVNEVALEDYVAGIAEMLSSWPMAALEAQAIAARTYALWEASRPGVGPKASLRYDVCSTTACQVYAGLDKAEEPNGRWAAAARATAGQVLLDERGAPILARYSSTAGGRTRFNQDVFIGEGSYPYLVAVDTPEEEGVAPLYSWRVSLARDRLDRILEASLELRPKGTLTGLTVRVPPEGSGWPTQVSVVGTDGERIMRAAAFSRSFSEVAERLFPEQFPGALPSAVPSSRFSLHLGPDGLRIDGRGYGHAVGLSQYGAKALADRGVDAAQILARYYGGLAPSRIPPSPQLRVGVAEREKEVTLAVDGAARLTDVKGRAFVERVTGDVRVTARDDGALALALAEAPPAPAWISGLDVASTSASEGELPQVTVVASGSRDVRVEASEVGGAVVYGPPTAVAAGRTSVPLPALGPGRWRIRVAGVPDAGEVPLEVRPGPPSGLEPRPAPVPPGRSPFAAALVVGAAAAAVVALIVVVGRRRT